MDLKLRIVDLTSYIIRTEIPPIVVRKSSGVNFFKDMFIHKILSINTRERVNGTVEVSGIL